MAERTVAQAPHPPDGLPSKVFQGGPTVLHKLRPLLRKKGFTGYVEVTTPGEEERGFIVMEDGRQIQGQFMGSEETVSGQAALPMVDDLSHRDDARIEVILDPDLAALPDRPIRDDKGRFVKTLDVLKQKLDEWRIKEEAKTESEAEPGDGSDAPDLGRADESLADEQEAGIRDLALLLEAQRMEEAAASQAAAEPEVEVQLSSVEGPSEDEEAEAAAEEPVPEEPARKKRPGTKRSPEPRAETGVNQSFTFDNLLVGEYNRFAHAACRAIAEGAVEPYSPLFLVGTPGLGKTHLLHAIGNRFRERDPEARVRYVTATEYWSELQRADQDGKVAEFRDRFNHVDILLLDDVQDIEGRDRVQEELFQTYEDFRHRRKPLVLVADKYPTAMEDVDKRIISRLESGLVADLKVPDPEIRLAFLEKLVKKRAVKCPKAVLEFLAGRYTVDMRELEGSLNKVLAYATAMQRELNVELSKEALGETGPASPASPDRGIDIVPGISYLFEESRSELAYQVFAQKVRTVRGLLISRTNPHRLQDRFGLDGTDVLWLTDRGDSEERTVEPVLERILHRMQSFMVSGGQGILMLDGLDFLKSSNSFEAVLKFIRRLVDEIAESEFSFILTLDPGTLDEQEIRILEREMEPVTPDQA